jgi:hypothetical protein
MSIMPMYESDAGMVRPLVTAYGRTTGPASRSSHLSLGALRDDAAAADQVAEDLLRMLGVPADEAHVICQRPLPSPDDLPLRDTAA